MPLDLLTIGRVSLDLFSEQAGAPFPQIRSFATSVGGSPVNIAIGANRLGIRSAALTAVSEDPVGDFVLRWLKNEGVETRYIARRPRMRTGLAVVGVQPPDRFPLIFYRDRAADREISLDDLAAIPIAETRVLLLSGTAFSAGSCRDTCFAAAELAHAAPTEVWLDLDLRPDQWSHPVAFGVTMRRTLPYLDVCIGTEEEWYAALAPDPRAILRGETVSAEGEGELTALLDDALARHPSLTALVKRGAAGVRILQSGHEALDIASQPVAVVNTVGAGDAFAAGLIASRLRSANWAEAARFANACGAIVVSRDGCSTAFPHASEVHEFLAQSGVPA